MTTKRAHNIKLAIFALILGCLVNAFAAALVKFASDKGLHPSVLLFGRYFVALFFLLFFMCYVEKGPPIYEKIRTKKPLYHLIRGTFTAFSVLLYYASLKSLSLSDATLLYLTVPLFMPIVAYLWGKEKIYPPLWWGISMGFLGVLLVIKPGHELFQKASLLALAAGILATVGQYAIRLLSRTEPVSRINFIFFSLAALIALVISLFHPVQNWGELSRLDLLILLGLGVFAVIYVPCLTIALKHAPAPFISSFLYTTVVFALILDIVIWRHLPSALTIVGFALIVSGVILKVLLYQKKPK